MNDSEFIEYIVLGLFLIIGLCFLIFPTVNFIQKKRKYTPVMAICRELDMRLSRTKNGGTREIYAPTWEYYFNGQYYTVKSNSYSNIDVPNIGEEYELLINPDEPEKFYRPSMKMLIFFWIFGGIWTFIPLMILFILSSL